MVGGKNIQRPGASDAETTSVNGATVGAVGMSAWGWGSGRGLEVSRLRASDELQREAPARGRALGGGDGVGPSLLLLCPV